VKKTWKNRGVMDFWRFLRFISFFDISILPDIHIGDFWRPISKTIFISTFYLPFFHFRVMGVSSNFEFYFFLFVFYIFLCVLWKYTIPHWKLLINSMSIEFITLKSKKYIILIYPKSIKWAKVVTFYRKYIYLWMFERK
jgi:hypothetical protein